MVVGRRRAEFKARFPVGDYAWNIDFFSGIVAFGHYWTATPLKMTILILAGFASSLRTLDALPLAVALSEDLQLVTAYTAFAQAARKLSMKARLISSQ